MSSFGRNLKSDHNLPLTLPILNIRGVGKAEQKKKRKKKRENENIYIIKEQIYEKFNFLVRLNSDTLHSGLFSHEILMVYITIGFSQFPDNQREKR